MRSKKFLLMLFYCSTGITSTFAQLQVGGQVRIRSEFRDGQGAPLRREDKPAFFTSQRTRLSLQYHNSRLKAGLTAQDVRVWGQEASTINRTTVADQNGLLLHEAWVELRLNDSLQEANTFSLKLGRQELVYDDSRLLGNLDWLQQGRRHDAALIKYEYSNWVLHGGAAYNQNKEAASGTVYNNNPAGNYPANTNGGSMYKSMEFVYVSRKMTNGNVSFLFFADQFSKYHRDSANASVKIFDPGTSSRFTSGFYLNQVWDKTTITGAAYYQFGRDEASRKIHAALLSVTAQYALNKKIAAGPGFDYTTGGVTGTSNRAFDPLYGTPHKFWGLMDYFYAASPFGNTGLRDIYFKSRWNASQRLLVTGDLHHFASATRLQNTVHPQGNKRYFGMELDLTASLVLTKEISFEGGYAHFFGTALLASPQVKNISNADLNSNWAYVSVNVKPQFFNK